MVRREVSKDLSVIAFPHYRLLKVPWVAKKSWRDKPYYLNNSYMFMCYLITLLICKNRSRAAILATAKRQFKSFASLRLHGKKSFQSFLDRNKQYGISNNNSICFVSRDFKGVTLTCVKCIFSYRYPLTRSLPLNLYFIRPDNYLMNVLSSLQPGSHLCS